MSRRRRHHPNSNELNIQKPSNQGQVNAALQRRQAPVQLLADEAVWAGGAGGQAEMLANPQLLTAQRTTLAEQIAQVQGNRHLGAVLSGAGLQGQEAGGNGHAIQRQGAPGGGHRMIRYGSQGPDVAEAQAKLNAAGATPPLAVDSIFGPLTRAATVAFQSAHNLSPDGIIGPLTWGALDQVSPTPEIPGPETPGPETPGPETPGPETPGPETPGPETPAERWSDEDAARLATQTSSTGVLTDYQASRAMLRVLALSESEYTELRTILDGAASDMEWAFLLKAAAAQRSVSDIAEFAVRINGMSERWLMRNLMVVDLVNDLSPDADPEERGITQQYGNSCGPTSVQLVHAQADPIYALELRSGGPIDQPPQHGVTDPESVNNEQLAGEQADILNAHAAAGTGNAPTDYAHPTGGAWVEQDLNAVQSATGVTYTRQLVGSDITLDAAITALYDGLAMGVQVPIVVGQGPGDTAHYVVVLLASGDRFLVHDVANGQTVWKTEEQFRSSTLGLPSGHTTLTGIDVPAPAPPPLPEAPSPSSG